MRFFRVRRRKENTHAMVVNRYLISVALLTTIACASTKGSSLPGSPNIILITLDTTRADRMGFLGSNRGLTPNLDALAKQSAIFTRAYSQFPLTPPSHATILSGTYPQFHHVNDMQMPLPVDAPYIPEILRAHGYHTAAFIGAIVLEPHAPYAPGFDRGFDTYDAGFHDDGPGADRFRTVQRRGAEVVAHALAWLNKHPKGPFFVWVHLYDAHDPYAPPEPYKTKYASTPYDGGIAYEDAVVGKFLRELKLRGLYNRAIMAVVADHGESLGAHGEDTHGVFLYDDTIRVPLLIKLPLTSANKPAADGPSNRIDNRVELVDIAPTLLQEAGIVVPEIMQGESLLGLIRQNREDGSPQDRWHDRPAYSESEYPYHFGWSALRSLRAEKYLYVQAPKRELYDDNSDPGAGHNLASSSPAVADTLDSRLEALRKKTTNLHDAPAATHDLAAQEKLGALGYMTSEMGAATPRQAGDPQAIDPKDRIEIANMIHQAELLQQDERSDESIALLEKIIAINPTAAFNNKLGTWLIRKQDYQRAIPALRHALEMDPESNGTLFLLGKALISTEDFSAAIPVLQSLVAKVPNAVEAHSFLELAYARTGRDSEAIAECETVLYYDPEDYGSYLILGQSLGRSGDNEGALQSLKKAVSLAPAAPVPHVWMAEVYDKLGQKTDAARERATARRLRSASVR